MTTVVELIFGCSDCDVRQRVTIARDQFAGTLQEAGYILAKKLEDFEATHVCKDEEDDEG